MSEAQEEAVPALFLHCEAVYEAMFASSTLVGESMVYEGYLTKLVTQDLRLSVPYYTHVTRALKDMGCIKPLRRGGSTTMSQWELGPKPDLERFLLIVAGKETGRKHLREVKRMEEAAQVQQQFTDIRNRLDTIERALGLS